MKHATSVPKRWGKASREIGGALQTKGKQTRRGHSIQGVNARRHGTTGVPKAAWTLKTLCDLCGVKARKVNKTKPNFPLNFCFILLLLCFKNYSLTCFPLGCRRRARNEAKEKKKADERTSKRRQQ